MLQDGIHYRGGGLPDCYRLMQVNVSLGASSRDVLSGLAETWAMLQSLRQGKVDDLRKELRPEDPDVILEGGNLAVLIGYGARLFDESIHSPALVKSSDQPRRLQYLRVGRKTAPFNRLKWFDPRDPIVDPMHDYSSQSDIGFQFTGDSELTVNRAIVETEKFIKDNKLPFYISGVHSGFKREDRRSWIDFHDGINNMSTAHRLVAMEIKGNDRDWLIDGTYMSFLKIHVDLDVWRSLSRETQELIVGRNKITACPLVDTLKDATTGLVKPTFQSGCLFQHTLPDPMPVEFRDPPQPSDAVAQAAHIFRSNLNRESPVQSANNRIYRQGYEFLEFDRTKNTLLKGLNFVGFHRTPKFLTDILGQRFWLGDANFGGLEEPIEGGPQSINLMLLLHGCYYGVPKKAEPFPGAELFENASHFLIASMPNSDIAQAKPVTEVKGIGKKYGDQLGELKIRTVADLANLDLELMQKADGSLPEIVGMALERGWIDVAKRLL